MPIKELFAGVFGEDVEGVYKGIICSLVEGSAKRESFPKTCQDAGS